MKIFIVSNYARSVLEQHTQHIHSFIRTYVGTWRVAHQKTAEMVSGACSVHPRQQKPMRISFASFVGCVGLHVGKFDLMHMSVTKSLPTEVYGLSFLGKSLED